MTQMPLVNESMSRRRFLATSAAGICAASVMAPLVARADTVLPTPAVLADLDNAAWVPDGRANDKQAYVIAAPWCPYCKALYDQVRPYTGQVQFRWIMAFAREPQHVRQNAIISYQRDPAALGHVYRSALAEQNLPPDAKWIAEWNEGVENAIRPTVISLLGRSATPKVFWMSKSTGGLIVINGAPKDLSSFLADVAPRPEATDIVPKATLIAGKVVSEKPIGNTMLFSRNGDPLFAIPDPSAPVVWEFPRQNGGGASKLATTQDGQQWAFFSLWNAGNNQTGGWAPLSNLTLHDGRPAVL